MYSLSLYIYTYIHMCIYIYICIHRPKSQRSLPDCTRHGTTLQTCGPESVVECCWGSRPQPAASASQSALRIKTLCAIGSGLVHAQRHPQGHPHEEVFYASRLLAPRNKTPKLRTPKKTWHGSHRFPRPYSKDHTANPERPLRNLGCGTSPESLL